MKSSSSPPPPRTKSRVDMVDKRASTDTLASLSSSKESLRPPSVEDLTFELALQDTPEVREQLRVAASESETAALHLKQFVRRAQSLRDALKALDKERQAFSASLRQLEGTFEGTPVKMICDSIEECNKLTAAEAQHVQLLLVDPLIGFTEDPSAAKKEHKNLCKLRSTFESWSDKVAANERKDVPSGKGDDALVQLVDARVQYRKGLLDYVENTKRGHRDVRAKVLGQTSFEFSF